MRFYTQQHAYYCGVDLHTKMMYLCVISQDGEFETVCWWGSRASAAGTG